MKCSGFGAGLLHWIRRVSVVGILLVLVACGGGGGQAGGGSPPTVPVPETPASAPDPTPVVQAPAATAVTLQSEASDPIGQGKTYGYSLANAEIKVTLTNKILSVTVSGDEDWTGDFQIPNGSAWQPARFDNANIFKPSISNVAAMRWFGLGRGCTKATGWFSIDQVDRADSYGLRSMILRFARYCDGAVGALKGEVRFQVSDATTPPAVASAPGTLWAPPAGAVPATGNYVYHSSATGDVVGLNRTQLYVPENTRIFGVGVGEYFEVYLGGRESWYGIFNGRKATRLSVGYYPDLVRYPFANPTRGGLSWVGGGRGCQDSRGWVAVDRVEYETLPGLNIKAIEYRFEQTCAGAAGPLRGAVRWTADALTAATPITSPGGWGPPVGSTPASGNYAYVNSSPGDALAAGKTTLNTPLDSVISLTDQGGRIFVDINGEDRWMLDLKTTSTGSPLVKGTYGQLGAPAGANGGPHFQFSVGSNTCAQQSWVVVDDVAYADGHLTALRLRFEALCQGSSGPIRGEIQWRADDLRPPAGPASTAPAVLWKPAAGTTPVSGQNYLRVESSRADFVGAGLSTTYTQANAAFAVSTVNNRLHLDVAGDQRWTADFAGPTGQQRLQSGFYSGLRRYPFHNPARGGMDVGSDGRAGNEIQGWFAIDRISYSPAGELLDVSLRFEQHAQGSTTGGLWGELSWASGDVTQPPGPVATPADLWQPAAGSTPASGSYLYFESSSVADFIGKGTTQTLTTTNAKLSLTQNQARATATFTADVGTSFPWTAEFKAMSSIARLQPGFYGGISGHLFQNPAKGGLSFTGGGGGCNAVDGWFVVDDVRYTGDQITALKIRFEQVCDGAGVLHGQINWSP